MTRLQHYIEVCYIVAGFLVAWDVMHAVKWRMMPEASGLLRAFAAPTFAPVTMVYFVVQFVRKEW